MTGTTTIIPVESSVPEQEERVEQTTNENNVANILRLNEGTTNTSLVGDNGPRKSVSQPKSMGKQTKSNDNNSRGVRSRPKERGSGVGYISLLSSVPAEDSNGT